MRTTFKNELIKKGGVIFVFLLTILGPALLFSQSHIAWIQRYNGSGNLVDQASRVAVDGNGNVYVTGRSDSIGTGSDMVTLKYSPNGSLLWERRYNGPGNANDYALYMELDTAGNVYVAGTSVGVGTSSDYTILKYDSNGNQLWVSRYSVSSSGDGMTGFTIDALGNSYLSGFSYVGGLNNYDEVVAKFNSQGNYLWSVIRDTGPGSWDVVEAIALAPDGSIYLSRNNLFGTPFLEKLFHWSVVLPEFYKQLITDKSGNIYIGNYLGNYITRKYDSSGTLIWERIYNGPANGNDGLRKMVIDDKANIYVTGQSPGVGTGNDFATIKYDSAGNQLWVQRFNGGLDKDDAATEIVVDNNGNVCVAGNSAGNGTHWDFAVIKYDSLGNFIWQGRYNGPGDSTDLVSDITADGNGNIFVTGSSFDGASNNDIATIKYSLTAVLKGDLDENGVLALDDVVSLLNCVFLGEGNCSPKFADVNCDASLSPADVVVLLLTFFALATPPC
ncbi:MAG: SBBP repeat-containing protein [Candidatus Zixiibacteriota bacterium]